MKMWKKTAALTAVAAVTMLSGSLNVSAAGVRDVFDAEYYADSYEDLREAFGYDTEALLRHYMTYGLSEGRSGSKVFDVAEYRSAYGDLEEAFGDDWDAYVDHYCTHGITEGRSAGVYGEIDLSKIDSSDAAADNPVDNNTTANDTVQETEEKKENADGKIYLHKGESVDVIHTVEGIEGSLCAKVTLVDVERQNSVVGRALRADGTSGSVPYSAVKFSLLMEFDPSVDWHNCFPGWSYGLTVNEELNAHSDKGWDDGRLIFDVTDGENTYEDCQASVGWSGLDYDTASQMLYIYVAIPFELRSHMQPYVELGERVYCFPEW